MKRREAGLTIGRRLASCATLLFVLAVAVGVPVEAQLRGSDPEHTLPLTWDRWLDHDEIGERMQLMAETWPEMLSLQSLGDSYGGREMWLMTINNPATGDEMDKAGMFIEANVHGNEIQGAEVILYTIWYLMENYGEIDQITRLVDERVFYMLPSVNPDGRDYFLDTAGSGARTGHVPVDSDGDGVFDEDGPNDLNGNGVIEQIRKYVPGQGTHRASARDARILEPVPPGEFGDYVRHAGEEFVYVVEGAIVAHTEFYEPVTLNVGESIYIDSSMGHAFLVAPGFDEALVLGVCSAAEDLSRLAPGSGRDGD